MAGEKYGCKERPVSRRIDLLRVRRLLAGLDEAVANDDVETARALLRETAFVLDETGIRRRTIPAESEEPPAPAKKSSR